MRCDRAGCLTEASHVSITDEPHQTKSTIKQIAQIDGKDGNKRPKRHKLIPKAFAHLLPFVACSA